VKRSVTLLVAVISAAALLSGCGGSLGPAAAKVGTTAISRDTLDDELRTISSNSTWMKIAAQSLGASLTAPEGGVSIKLSTAWLYQLVQQAAVDQIFDQRHLTVSAANRATAKDAAYSLFGDQKTFKELPRSFQDTVLRRQERRAAVEDVAPPLPKPTDAELKTLFDQVGSQVCPTAEAVAHIQLDTKEQADAVEALLAQGGDFAALAAQYSTDKPSAPSGGIIACKQTQHFSEILQPLQDTANALAVGAISQPVQTTDGWSIVKMVAWDFESGKAVIAAIREAQLASPITQLVLARLVKSHVWIDPRYGKLVKRGGNAFIQPPTAPNPPSKPPAPSTSAAADVSGQ
jgi:parvulin-like peptidyl-prolyl isomerase